MTSWLITLGGLVASWHYTDLNADSSLQNTLCPILVAIFLIASVIKFALLAGPSGGGSGSGGDGGGFGGGGDCGGGGGDC